MIVVNYHALDVPKPLFLLVYRTGLRVEYWMTTTVRRLLFSLMFQAAKIAGLVELLNAVDPTTLRAFKVLGLGGALFGEGSGCEIGDTGCTGWFGGCLVCHVFVLV